MNKQDKIFTVLIIILVIISLFLITRTANATVIDDLRLNNIYDAGQNVGPGGSAANTVIVNFSSRYYIGKIGTRKLNTPTGVNTTHTFQRYTCPSGTWYGHASCILNGTEIGYTPGCMNNEICNYTLNESWEFNDGDFLRFYQGGDSTVSGWRTNTQTGSYTGIDITFNYTIPSLGRHSAFIFYAEIGAEQ